MRPIFATAVGVLAASLAAQNAVLPTSATGIAGNASNTFPWGSPATAFPGLRIQCIYDSSHFTSATPPINYPIQITHVRWRANEVAATTSWTGGTYSNASLALATAAIDQAAATTNWASNCGPDYTTVYSGAVTVQPGVGGGTGTPGPYVVDIALTTPFLYDPSQGDLVVDTNFVSGAWSGGTQPAMDVHSTNLLAQRVYSSSLYPNANGVDANVPVIEVDFVGAGPGTYATNTTLGAGCINVPDVSSYESFATSAAFDLAISSISLLRTNSGYIAIPGFTSYLPPSPAAQVLTLADNSETVVTLAQPMPVGLAATTTTLNVCSNGFISAGTGNTVLGTPNAMTLLNAPRTCWCLCWHDFNPSLAAGGRVKFEQTGGVAYVTWEGVWDAGGTTIANASTMQAQFELATGIVHYVYGTTSALGNARLVGFSDAGPSANPGSMDISAALPATYTAAVFAVAPLTVAGLSRPIVGANWSFAVTNVPATGTVGVDVFGLSDPGLTDLGFLGLPGCGLRASLDLLTAWIVSGGSHAYALAIPNDPMLTNLHVFTTSVVLQPLANPYGAITANGIDGRLGDY